MLGLFKANKKLKHPTILIVDDEPDFVSTVKCQLRWCNYRVITACNGQEGLEKAVAEKPDVILMDINMPVMNGRDMLSKLRTNPKIQDTPVIILTALCQAADIAAVSSYGITDYVTKPFDFTELMDKINGAIEHIRH